MKRLSNEQLHAIRKIVTDVSRGELRRTELVDAVGAISELRVTVDGSARESLGAPLVVVEPRREPPPFLAMLTRREVEVVEQIAAGLTNQEIAETLFISVATVKDHVHNVLRKTQLPHRGALIAAYLS